jgi:anti-sigma regulatory factor (Ser/Thr protein kinase)
MTGQKRNGVTLPATPDAVDRYCADLRRTLLPGLPEAERFAVELLAREALMNAVEHGANYDPAHEISCEIETFAGGVRICVEDGGRGFDWAGPARSSAHPLSEAGRGLRILSEYADRLEFFGNGNRVELTRMFSKE